MVSNEEIKQMLEAKRKGIDIKKEKTDKANYKVCPNCKTKNPEKALFCVKCGNKLDKNIKVECPSCGTPNPTNAKFCVGCGETLNKETPTGETVQAESPKTAEPELETEISIEKTETTPPKTPEPGVSKKTPPKTGIPSSVPEQGIINQTSFKKTCTSCKGENPKNSKFCVVCGEKFDDIRRDETLEVPDETTAQKTVPDDVKSDETSLINKVQDKEEPVLEDSSKDTTPKIKVPESFKKRDKEDLTPKKPVETVLPTKTEVEEDMDVDPIEKIKKAKELLDIGAITTEEFESIKKKYPQKI